MVTGLEIRSQSMGASFVVVGTENTKAMQGAMGRMVGSRYPQSRMVARGG